MTMTLQPPRAPVKWVHQMAREIYAQLPPGTSYWVAYREASERLNRAEATAAAEHQDES